MTFHGMRSVMARAMGSATLITTVAWVVGAGRKFI